MKAEEGVWKKCNGQKRSGKSSVTLQEKSYQDMCDVLKKVRSRAYKAVNFAMVQAYWAVGRLIVEDEQQGKNVQNTAKLPIKPGKHDSLMDRFL